VPTALKTALARPNVDELMQAVRAAWTFAELERVVQAALAGRSL
jgi:hypothetical protein